jgi:hypothetical protein
MLTSVDRLALLGACTSHGDMKMGELNVKQVLELDPGNAADSVLLSTIYDVAGSKWDLCEKCSTTVESKGILFVCDFLSFHKKIQKKFLCILRFDCAYSCKLAWSSEFTDCITCTRLLQRVTLHLSVFTTVQH